MTETSELLLRFWGWGWGWGEVEIQTVENSAPALPWEKPHPPWVRTEILALGAQIRNLNRLL